RRCEATPQLHALLEHLGPLRVVTDALDGRPHQDQVRLRWDVRRVDEGSHHPGHVLETVPPAYLQHVGDVPGQWVARDHHAGVAAQDIAAAVPPGEADF